MQDFQNRPDAQADLSLRWAHTHFVGFVVRRLIPYAYYLHASLKPPFELQNLAHLK